MTEEKKTSPAGLVESTSYTYDDANRMTSAGGVTYEWDNNGNLLSDGTNTYTYNHSNKLTIVNGPSSIVSFTYNGLGDRLSETVNGVTTIFMLDLNAGLTQVLADGTHVYLYGLGRIAQTSTTESVYFLGDALGSVRQLADGQGTVVLARAYEPYGSVLSTAGEDATKYGFTGEWQENGLIHLRARDYFSDAGVFLTRDLFRGYVDQPGSLNNWNYTAGNPIRFMDPSGNIREDNRELANDIIKHLAQEFSIYVQSDWGYTDDLLSSRRGYKPHETEILEYMASTQSCGNTWYPGFWTLPDLYVLTSALYDMSNTMGLEPIYQTINPYTMIVTGHESRFRNMMGNYIQVDKSKHACGRGCTSYPFYITFLQRNITTEDTPLDEIGYAINEYNLDFDKWSVVHEFGHWLDGTSLFSYSSTFEVETDGHTGGWLEERPSECDEKTEYRKPGCNAAKYFYGGIPPKGSDWGFNREEDFAESFAAYLYPDAAQKEIAKYKLDVVYGPLLFYPDYRLQPRWKYMDELIHPWKY